MKRGTRNTSSHGEMVEMLETRRHLSAAATAVVDGHAAPMCEHAAHAGASPSHGHAAPTGHHGRTPVVSVPVSGRRGRTVLPPPQGRHGHPPVVTPSPVRHKPSPVMSMPNGHHAPRPVRHGHHGPVDNGNPEDPVDPTDGGDTGGDDTSGGDDNGGSDDTSGGDNGGDNNGGDDNGGDNNGGDNNGGDDNGGDDNGGDDNGGDDNGGDDNGGDDNGGDDGDYACFAKGGHAPAAASPSMAAADIRVARNSIPPGIFLTSGGGGLSAMLSTASPGSAKFVG